MERRPQRGGVADMALRRDLRIGLDRDRRDATAGHQRQGQQHHPHQVINLADGDARRQALTHG